MNDPDPVGQLKTIQKTMHEKAARLAEQMRNTDANGHQKPAPAEPAPQPVESNEPLDPGPGDGGARQPLPALSLQEQADQATANGDHGTAMSIKSQQIAGLIQKRNEGN